MAVLGRKIVFLMFLKIDDYKNRQLAIFEKKSNPIPLGCGFGGLVSVKCLMIILLDK